MDDNKNKEFENIKENDTKHPKDIYEKQLQELYKERVTALNKKLSPSWFDKLYTPIIFTSLIFSVASLFADTNNYIDKVQTKNMVSTLIFNNAELDTIKYAYNTQSLNSSSSIRTIFKDKSNKYPSGTQLSRVLMDIKTDLFKSEKPDANKIDKINSIISINEIQNPFSGLDNNQVDLFKNIQIKSGDKYQLIQPEINKLANQIINDNIQISQSSTESKISFYVSIISFISAIAIAAFQIIQSRPQQIKKIFISAIEEIEAKKWRSQLTKT